MGSTLPPLYPKYGNMNRLYLALADLGLSVPYYVFEHFLLTRGHDQPLLLDPLFANDISPFSLSIC